MRPRPTLVVVTTNEMDTVALRTWLRRQADDDEVVFAHGFYAGISAVERVARAVVVDVGDTGESDRWRLAELRSRRPDATFVVVAEAAALATLAGALAADLAVTGVDALPPLRELLVDDEPLPDDQAGWRRSSR